VTNKERVIAAIKHEQPDKVPHNVMFTKEMLDKMIVYSGNNDYINTINNHITKVSMMKPQIPAEDLNEHFIDEFGIIWNKSGVDKDIGVVAGYKLKDPDQIMDYIPPPVDEEYVHAQCRLLMDTKGDNFAFASIGFTLFERAWSLCGMNEFLCYMMTDPEAVENLLSKLAERNIKKAKIALEYDIDGVLYGDDWGQQRGMIMGPSHWRELIKPHVAAMYAEVKSKGKYVAHHSCGDLKMILDDLAEIGLDVYQTFQPEIYDIREYKEKLNPNLSIWGAISTQAHLPFKTPGEIYEITKETMKILGKGGGYIAAPTHDVPGDVPPENLEAMVKAFIDQ